MKNSLILQHILIKHWKDPLYKNSFYILLSYLTGAGFGFIFWLLAAKFYQNEDVGIAAALISSISLIVLISGFGLDQSIIRFFPDRNKNKVFSTSVIITTTVSVLLGMIFIVGSDLWLPEQGILKSSIAVFYLLFLAVFSFVGLTGISFIAMRKAEYNFLQNVIAGSRFFFLFPFILFGAMGIFGAVGASFILAFIMSVVLLVRSGIKFVFTLDRRFLRDALNFSAGNYLAGLLITAPSLILPIMVLNVLGAEETAHYYIAYSITVLLFMIPSAVSTSLFVEGSHGETLKKNTMKSLFIIFILLLPAIIILYLFGGFILGIIGKSYVEGLDLMRIMALSSFFVAIVYVYFSIKKVQKDMKGLVLLSAVLFFLLIGLSYVFMPVFGIVGVGYAWIGGYGLCSVVVGVMVLMEWWF
jgi:O-antigen/teichoic acid export membrane protein